MKKILYLFLFVFGSYQAKAQNCNFTATSNATGVYTFAPNQQFPAPWFHYLWSFGDGTSSTANNPTHTYGPGTYIVCYDILDTNNSMICRACDSIYVGPPSNNCFLTYTLDPGTLGLVHFAASPSSTGSIILWNFSDGSSDSGLTVSHFFTPGATYSACISEYNFLGLVCSHCQNFTITSGGNCGFIVRPDSNNVNSFDFIAQVNSTGFYSVNWSYGDNTIGSGYAVNHLYNAPGSYTVCMEARDSLNNLICTACNVVVAGGNPTTCSFTYRPDFLSPGDWVFETATTAGYNYTWTFGNGTTITGNPVSVTYSPAQNIDSVCLVITDAGTGAIVCVYCDMVYLNPNQGTCQAAFAAVSLGFNAYFVDLSATFTPSTSYQWSFGDGTGSSLRFPQHQYNFVGSYTICLTIVDGNCQDTYCQTLLIDSVIVPPIGCNAYFVVTQIAPFQLAVVNLSNGVNISYNWDFGDGTNSNLAYPSHIYASTGFYQLCLTIADGSGCTSTYCDSLSVDSLGRIIYRGTTAGFSINVMSPAQITTTVNELSKEISSSLYPNPATSSIGIKSTELKGALNFRITSITGAEVSKGSLSSFTEMIKIEELNPGMYLLQLTDSHQNTTFGRFIKN